MGRPTIRIQSPAMSTKPASQSSAKLRWRKTVSIQALLLKREAGSARLRSVLTLKQVVRLGRIALPLDLRVHALLGHDPLQVRRGLPLLPPLGRRFPANAD